MCVRYHVGRLPSTRGQPLQRSGRPHIGSCRRLVHGWRRPTQLSPPPLRSCTGRKPQQTPSRRVLDPRVSASTTWSKESTGIAAAATHLGARKCDVHNGCSQIATRWCNLQATGINNVRRGAPQSWSGSCTLQSQGLRSLRPRQPSPGSGQPRRRQLHRQRRRSMSSSWFSSRCAIP